MLNAANSILGFRFPRTAVVSAIARRDFLLLRSYRLAFALDTFFGVLELAAYFFISRTFGDVSSASLQGAPSYFAFAAVGLILGAVMYATSAAVASRLREEQLTGTLEALTTQPLSSLELCVGLVSFPFAFASLRASLYLIVASFWMHLDVSHTSWPGVAATLIGAAFALAPVGILAAALVLLVKRGLVVVGILVSTMGLLGGAVFPISVLPDWLEWAGRAMPVRFAFDGVRAALFTGHGWEHDAVALLAFGAALAPIALAAFALAFRHAKKAGTVSEY
jgi:ABC-2 type transport system permease protein